MLVDSHCISIDNLAKAGLKLISLVCLLTGVTYSNISPKHRQYYMLPIARRLFLCVAYRTAFYVSALPIERRRKAPVDMQSGNTPPIDMQFG